MSIEISSFTVHLVKTCERQTMRPDPIKHVGIKQSGFKHVYVSAASAGGLPSKVGAIFPCSPLPGKEHTHTHV